MYLELDGDEVALTYIKDVTFNANRADVEVSKMTKVHAVCAFFYIHTIGCELMYEIVYFLFSATICNGEMDCWDI